MTPCDITVDCYKSPSCPAPDFLSILFFTLNNFISSSFYLSPPSHLHLTHKSPIQLNPTTPASSIQVSSPGSIQSTSSEPATAAYTHTHTFSRGNKKGLPPPSKSHWHPVPANASSPYSNFVSLPTNQRPIHRQKPPPATASVLPLLRLALVLSPPTNPSIKSKFAQLQLRTPASVSRILRCCSRQSSSFHHPPVLPLSYPHVLYTIALHTAHTIREVHHLLSLSFHPAIKDLIVAITSSKESAYSPFHTPVMPLILPIFAGRMNKTTNMTPCNSDSLSQVRRT